MTNRARLDKLETALTGPGEGSADPCPKCGGLRIETLLREAAALNRALQPGDELDAEQIYKAAREASERQKAARCRRCGALAA
jgi:hypothetical protein